MSKYYTIIIITILLYAISAILAVFVSENPPLVNWFFAGFFGLYSILFTYLISRVLILKPKAFVRRFMALTGIKFLLCLLFLSLVLWLAKDYKIFTAIHFLIQFLIYLIIEVMLLLSQLKKIQTKKTV